MAASCLLHGETPVVSADVVHTDLENKALLMSSKENMSNEHREQVAAWLLEHAQQGLRVLRYPVNGRTAHTEYVRSIYVSNLAFFVLLLLSLVESPAWCADKCGDSPDKDSLFFGGFQLPRFVAHVINLFCLALVTWHLWSAWRLDQMFKLLDVSMSSLGHAPVLPFCVLVGAAAAESIASLAHHAAFGPGVVFHPDKLQLIFRALMFLRAPDIRRNVKAMGNIFVKLLPPLMFFASIIAFFALVCLVLFDDWKAKDQTVAPPNTGFETYTRSLFSLFSLATTASLPDTMVAPYYETRVTVLIFVPFLFLSQIVALQLALATVFDCYTKMNTQERTLFEKHGQESREVAFILLSEDGTVSRETFVRTVMEYGKTQGKKLSRSVAEVLFVAANDDGSEDGVDAQEFRDICDLLQFQVWTTAVHSWPLRRWPRLLERRSVLSLKKFVGYASGEEDSEPQASSLEKVMTYVLGANMLLIIVEVYYDLQDVDTPSALELIDFLFTVIYCSETLAKVAVMSWGRYVAEIGNCIDLFSTILILVTQAAVTAVGIRIYANVFRVLRLLKLITFMRFEQMQRVVSTVVKMMRASEEVLRYFLIVLFFWGALGVAIFGGRIKAKEGDQLQLWNFNDLPNAMFSLVIMVLISWWDDLFIACLDSFQEIGFKLLVVMFFIACYVSAVLLAFNIFVPFAISAYNASQEGSPDQILQCISSENLASMRRKAREKDGILIYLRPTASLLRQQIARDIFHPEDADDAAQNCQQQLSLPSESRGLRTRSLPPREVSLPSISARGE
eukprot:TRINITY_DN62796_c0_g1_i1.p1 TRINITY_DN62796_c0_g1~~TRINITY_DN62796_c0_g1_i1.p1  ORF type:complete len:802 (+),score=129.90 TRINITY_DN62796_c0_g1_i1:40-2406(+)